MQAIRSADCTPYTKPLADWEMAWVSVLVLPQLLQKLSRPEKTFLILGGVLYMIGAILLRLQRPNPSLSFGYHEVWHTFVFLAGACHFAMSWMALQ